MCDGMGLSCTCKYYVLDLILDGFIYIIKGSVYLEDPGQNFVIVIHRKYTST